MAYCSYVTTLKNVRKHGNADRLQLADCFGNTVCVNLDYYEGQIGVYFPTDGQLSIEFCEYNNLVRKKNEAGENIGGYLDAEKRNVKCIKLRGEKSDGLFLPLHCLDFCFEDGNAEAHLKVGDTISVVNGHSVCQKYIPRSNRRGDSGKSGNKTRKKSTPIAPLFMEHADTSQLAYNLGDFRAGDQIEITLKMHGTSQRTAYLPVLNGYNDTLKCRIINAIKSRFKKNYEPKHDGTPIYDWDYISGTRRVVLDTYNGGFYGSNEFRKQHHDFFVDKLWMGETVYYEVVGFTHTGAPIMGQCENAKLNDKAFVKKYGKTTTFSYGCHPNGWSANSPGYNHGRCEPQSDIYVYRMTMTNEDGNVVEYTPDFMRYRCEQMGVKTVPVFWKGIVPKIVNEENLPDFAKITVGDWVRNKAEQYYEGKDPIGKTHVREGVVVRIVNRPKFTAYKHKNFSFKVLEGIIKDTADAPDMEEAEELVANE